MDERLISPERFAELAGRLAPVYAGAQPFPHVVMDDFLPAAAAQAILRQFPDRQHEIWNRQYHSHSKKLATNDLTVMPDPIRECLLVKASGGRGGSRELPSPRPPQKTADQQTSP